MRVPIDKALRDICAAIVGERKTAEEWAEMESDDMFSEGSFAGGYDADESAFCFSFFATDRKEYWFQFTLDEARRIADGGDVPLDAREAG